MRRVILERFETSDQGTFGRLYVDSILLYVGELPDRGNKPNLSCIPFGEYKCRYTMSPAFKKKTYEVFGVPGRAGIRIHAANLMGDKTKGFISQLYGCLAPGEKLGSIDGQKAILLSAPAVRKFEKLMAYQPFILEIKNA